MMSRVRSLRAQIAADGHCFGGRLYEWSFWHRDDTDFGFNHWINLVNGFDKSASLQFIEGPFFGRLASQRAKSRS
jgi:hypothetical protein